jgi:hypothetical protein
MAFPDPKGRVGHPDHTLHRTDPSLVGVGDRELDAGQSASDEAAEELGPERLGLGLADVDGEDLAPPGLVDAVRDDQRLAANAAAVADLLDLGVQEHVGVLGSWP